MDNISELRHCSVEARCRMPCARKCHLSSRRIWLVFRDAFSFFLCQTTVPFALAGYRNSWLTGKEGKRISLSRPDFLSFHSCPFCPLCPLSRHPFFGTFSSVGAPVRDHDVCRLRLLFRQTDKSQSKRRSSHLQQLLLTLLLTLLCALSSY